MLAWNEMDAGNAREEYARAKNNIETITLLTRTDFGRKQDDAVGAALKLRDALAAGLALSTNEKIEVVTLINQLKVKTVSIGTNDGYRAFQILDSVSEDIKRYL